MAPTAGDNEDLPEVLRTIPIFSSLHSAQLDAIRAASEVQHVLRGEVIIREEEQATRAFYVLLDGEARVAVTGNDGREAVLAFLEAGDFFGEMSLLDGDPRSATVRAGSPCRLLLIRRLAFADLLRRHPDIAIAMLTELSLRLRNANARISSLALKPVQARVAASLLQLVETRGMRVQGRAVIRDRPTQQEIADMASTTRETVSRVLSQFQRDGWILMEGRDIQVLAEDRLKAES